MGRLQSAWAAGGRVRPSGRRVLKGHRHVEVEALPHPSCPVILLTVADASILATLGSVGIGVITASAALLGQSIAVRSNRKVAIDARQAALRVERRDVFFKFLESAQDVERIIEKLLYPEELTGDEVARITHEMRVGYKKIELLCSKTASQAAADYLDAINGLAWSAWHGKISTVDDLGDLLVEMRSPFLKAAKEELGIPPG
jgi:hypothetical protein